MTIDPFAPSRARWAEFIDSEMALGFRSNVAGIVALHLAVAIGVRTFPAWEGTKMPRYAGWQEKATANPNSIVFWTRRFGLPDFIVPTGRENGVWIIDIDGPRGRARLAELEGKYGPLPATWTVVSGRADGGEHRWFKPTADGPDLKSVGKALIDGKRDCIDQKGRGGYAVIPGSLHASGRRYQWAPGRAPNECEMASLPVEWVSIVDWADERSEHQTLRPSNSSGRRGSRVSRNHDPASLLIGDGAGYGGFQDPIYKNAIRYFLDAGVEAPVETIITTLREIIIDAPKDHGRDVSRYLSGPDLPRLVERAWDFVKAVRTSEYEYD